jgi:hypothetical protein
MPVAKTFMVLCASFVSLICHAKEPYMSDTKTYCIGRYLIDMPADALINGQTYDYKYGRIESSSAGESEDSFAKEMDRRAADLKAGKHRKGYALTNVRRAGPTVAIFQLSQQLFMGPSLGFESYRWDGGHTFMLEQLGTMPARYESVLTDVQTSLLPNLHARGRDDIPAGPGFCLKDGFIANDGASPQFEDAAITFKFAQWPGVWVSIETMTVAKLGQPSLLQRIDKGLPDAFKDLVNQIRVLRRGQRTINGRTGEEYLATFPTDAGYRLHQFQWEARGTEIGDGLTPTITVELESGMERENGVPIRPRLTDDQAIALFDAVANSVRLRPVNHAKTSEVPDRPKAPLGTLAQTGTACPQTGWWTCPEAVANEIEGGRRQRFEAGTTMPIVQVLNKQSLIERMTGRQQRYGVSTVWRLVAYDANADPAQADGD